MLARSSSVRSSPAIHSACLIISGVTVPAWAACAARARRNVAVPTPRHRQAFQEGSPVESFVFVAIELLHGMFPVFSPS